MSIVDQIVRNLGVTITVERVTAPVYDDQDVLDEDASTIETEDVQAIKANSEEGHEVQDSGRQDRPRARFVVPTTTDVDPNRPGRPDRIIEADGTTYEVLSRRNQTNPFAPGVQKLHVDAMPLPGH